MADKASTQGAGTNAALLIAVEELATAHDRSESERSDVTSSQNSAGDDDPAGLFRAQRG